MPTISGKPLTRKLALIASLGVLWLGGSVGFWLLPRDGSDFILLHGHDSDTVAAVCFLFFSIQECPRLIFLGMRSHSLREDDNRTGESYRSKNEGWLSEDFWWCGKRSGHDWQPPVPYIVRPLDDDWAFLPEPDDVVVEFDECGRVANVRTPKL
jgi:hypothetical protein